MKDTSARRTLVVVLRDTAWLPVSNCSCSDMAILGAKEADVSVLTPSPTPDRTPIPSRHTYTTWTMKSDSKRKKERTSIAKKRNRKIKLNPQHTSDAIPESDHNNVEMTRARRRNHVHYRPTRKEGNHKRSYPSPGINADGSHCIELQEETCCPRYLTTPVAMYLASL